ncbi:MAG: hypothetical protein MPJ50_00480 [Pirellulales bacterium]|nr:hypothetical protein [Pirellulales bacterium]
MSVSVSMASPAARPAVAQNPSADEVIQKYIVATGGKEALEKVKTLQMRGTMQGNTQIGPVTADLTIYQRGDAFLLTVAMPGFGDIVKGRNGDLAWGPRKDGSFGKLEGKEKEQFLRDSQLHEQLSWIGYDGQVSTKGHVVINGKPCWHLLFEPSSGNAVDRYFEKDSGLLTKISMVSATETGEVSVETYLSDYRETSGIKTACEIKQVQDAGEQKVETVYRFTEVKANESIPDSCFEPPPGIDG